MGAGSGLTPPDSSSDSATSLLRDLGQVTQSHGALICRFSFPQNQSRGFAGYIKWTCVYAGYLLLVIIAN